MTGHGQAAFQTQQETSDGQWLSDGMTERTARRRLKDIATMHSVTDDRQTDRQTMMTNSRSHCVAVRSAAIIVQVSPIALEPISFFAFCMVHQQHYIALGQNVYISVWCGNEGQATMLFEIINKRMNDTTAYSLDKTI